MYRHSMFTHTMRMIAGTEGWQCCLTCEQMFNGAMAIGLAEEYVVPLPPTRFVHLVLH